MKMFLRNSRIAIFSIRGYGSQSVLSIIQLMLGAACLLFALSLGLGSQKEMQKQLASLGENVIIILPGQVSSLGRGDAGSNKESLRPSDVKEIEKIAEVKEASVGIRNSFLLKCGDKIINSEVTAVSPSFKSIRNWEIDDGRFIDNNDIRSLAKVCVIGETIRKKFFGEQNPIGERIFIKGERFCVIGTLESKGFSISGRDQDEVVYVPFTTAQKRLLGQNHIGFIVASAKNKDNMEIANEKIRKTLRAKHNLKDYQDDDFTLMNQSEFSRTSSATNRVMTRILGAISFMSLLSGGVGIMNILLVSARERTREIGLRMALGARRKDISTQFFIEGSLISFGGAGIGVIIGVGVMIFIITVFHWTMFISPLFLFLSLIASASVGIFFSYWPARKASRLNPIDALKYE